jgi:hypothetical protein
VSRTSFSSLRTLLHDRRTTVIASDIPSAGRFGFDLKWFSRKFRRLRLLDLLRRVLLLSISDATMIVEPDWNMHTSAIIATLREHEGELRSAGVEHLSLFGSWARGAAVPVLSDIDLIADFDARREYSLLDRVRLENRLADILGAKVDLVPARALKDGIRERVVREAVLAF